eukprot:CAMPEP_0180781562 /NCGR_PEP_ID=MMETSP1038_2-20121128/47744_1 /TAXON_ID=632150 /ORGANISM="Azadinium spinosum, Strain 3D9" /LENGTH=206 /DNA_ID=CAMNT_0022817447 /DNA_START=23 /DNA_END=640 /DNA_ORIENTATION=-
MAKGAKCVVAPREDLATSPLGDAQGTRMGRFDDKVARGIDDLPLLLCEVAHEDEDKTLLACIQDPHDLVGEMTPAALGMGIGLPTPHSERGVEHEEPLPGPLHEVPMLRSPELGNVHFELFVHVLEAGWRRDAWQYTEAEAMSLARRMVRILPDDDRPHVLKRSRIEGLEHQLLGRVDRLLNSLLRQEARQLHKVGLRELLPQGLL